MHSLVDTATLERPAAAPASRSVSLVFTGSGGAGAMTAGQILLDAAAKAGFYGLMSRSMGPQIRGGEAAAMLRLSNRPVAALGDGFDLLVAFDWGSVARFAAELPLGPKSLVLVDDEQGETPAFVVASGAEVLCLAFERTAEAIPDGRVNMVGVGAAARLIGLDPDGLVAAIETKLGRKGAATIAAAKAAIEAGERLVAEHPPVARLGRGEGSADGRWNISGNEATGLGAIRGGIGFVAAYPITPSTEILEWMAPALERTGGVLVQAEDELASINMIIGASFSGVPSMTATSGPGLSLMSESLGLAVASETPVVVVDVMRGGPSTGIPTKSEQSDLAIALDGLHGDAPHLVLAPNSIDDCLATTQWAVHLAEKLQTPAIVLSDQSLGQSRVVTDRPPDRPYRAERLVAAADTANYRRYAVTESGVSPMAIPGTPGLAHVADGLEHSERGTPSAAAADHQRQLDKRQGKLDRCDYGADWADVEGDGAVAIVTWGSVTGPAREAAARLRARGEEVRLISLRLLAPARPVEMAAALSGVERLLVVEQSHSKQFLKYLRANYDLPTATKSFARPGPLPVRPVEIEARLSDWSMQ
ncbi:2-oxoacid:acceptor oxidoreductase subunit alpha [Siculibacillus lacustris]|uniref:2-oxoacid:acceptor oxidoreductase subunit alpha n=1 Tax=Siculibacillus lacustris TaxID=1549641 RepID=A0A4Q9VMJ2_9HYPH|nr:2-oxoacid:acceptor oxidoreductase subunit alpha [Siculibacillus lacustris]TBW36790.1 2-oxoacid:acceptor oxidoreductase subunit alpha [Siculibacillus lacustris]